MSKFVDDTVGILVGVARDSYSGNTSLQSFGPSGCVSIEDQHDYPFAVFDPNDGNVFIRSADTLSGSMSIESVCAELYFNDGFIKNYSLSEPNNRQLVSGYEKYSIVGNFNEIYNLYEALNNFSQGFKAGTVSGISFEGNPKFYDVIFDSSYSDISYSINITGENSRIWGYNNKSTSGFTITSNASRPILGLVDWQTQRHGS